MDATHFRQRAARAREMAQSGDDFRLSRMLLEVAADLDAEADAIEADIQAERRTLPRVRPHDCYEALLYGNDRNTDGQQVHIVNLSAGGARFRGDDAPSLGSRVVLELPDHAVRLSGTIIRQRGIDTAMVFDPAVRGDPDLSRLLSASQGDRLQA